ncbi:MAG: ATP-binding cassette domain-containing protein [Bacteroidota bacterium]
MQLRPLQRFSRLLRLDKKDLVYLYLYSIFAGLIALTLPLGIQAIINMIAAGALNTSWGILLAMVTIGTALTGILTIMQISITETLQRRIFVRSSFEFAYRIPRLRVESLNGSYAPELVNRFFDTLTIQKGIPKLLIDSLTAVLQIFFGLILLSFYHPFFVFFGLALVIIVLAILFITGRGGMKTSLKESKQKYAVAYWLEEIARAMNTFKLACPSGLALRKTDEKVQGYLSARKNHFRVLLVQYSSMVAFKTVITAALLILGSLLVVQNQINLGQFVAAEIVVLRILSSVEKLIFSFETVYDVLTGLEKIGGVMDIPLEQDPPNADRSAINGQGLDIEIKDLNYTYPKNVAPSLRDLNVRIRPGEKVTVVGTKGSGKSTLLRILNGNLQEYSGAFNINGVPMINSSLDKYRDHIGVFTDQEDIFRGSVYDNISLGDRSITMENVVAGCQSLGIADYIEQLPNGYFTNLLPGGSNLPSNYVTKIILARAIASKPSIILMEDLLSGLTQGEHERIINLLTAPEQPWSLFIISNDREIANKTDRVILMRDGQIIHDLPQEEARFLADFQSIVRPAESPASVFQLSNQ